VTSSDLEQIIKGTRHLLLDFDGPVCDVFAGIPAAHRTGRTVTIVSNNSGAAFAAYLSDHRLTGYIRAIVARDDHDPERMKPSTYRVREAVGLLDADNAECVFVGDTTSDVFAGLLAGVPLIGYANKPGKTYALAEAQAAYVAVQLSEITDALRASPVT
jgi:phosphoglycolate phosphatase-like HAD superfamily hydrolase